MKLNKFFLIFLLMLSGCARPNYQTPQSPALEQQNPSPEDSADPTKPTNPTEETCELFLKVERLCVKLNWEKVPTETEKGSFLLKFYIQEKPKEYVDPRNSVNVVLWMPDMGHGSSPVTVKKVATGEYQASNVFFIMPGNWDIRIQLKDGNNVVDQVIKNIKI